MKYDKWYVTDMFLALLHFRSVVLLHQVIFHTINHSGSDFQFIIYCIHLK